MNIEEIVARLRQTESRSKRKLLDEAADAIEELAKASIVKRIPCEVDPRKEYVELDGIRLVCEEGQIVGWYRPGDGLANPVVPNMTNISEKRKGVVGVRNGESVQFQSVKDAAIAVNGARANITRSCNSKTRKAYGYKWMWAGERMEVADNEP